MQKNPTSFKSLMEESAKRIDSDIILALDLPQSNPAKLLTKARNIIEQVKDHICAVKFNRHLILPLGLFNGTQSLLKQIKSYNLPTIMDCKINDIGNTNRIIAEYYFNAGFEAVTLNPFVGWTDGLEPVFKAAHSSGRGVIMLTYMSHRGAWEGYGQQVVELNKLVVQYEIFAKKALKWNADGAVVGATYPKKIKEIFSILKNDVPIYSPGIGAQGGNIFSALKNGARYLIIGRSITLADNPKEKAKEFKLKSQAAKE